MIYGAKNIKKKTLLKHIKLFVLTADIVSKNTKNNFHQHKQVILLALLDLKCCK